MTAFWTHHRIYVEYWKPAWWTSCIATLTCTKAVTSVAIQWQMPPSHLAYLAATYATNVSYDWMHRLFTVLKITFKTSQFKIISSNAACNMLCNICDELVIVTVEVQFDFTKKELQFGKWTCSWCSIMVMQFVYIVHLYRVFSRSAKSNIEK